MKDVGPGRTKALVINTPEGISFSLPLASPITRFFAWAIDLGVILAATIVISYLVTVIQIFNPDLAGAIVALSFFAVSIGYGIFMEWFFRGQTLGKRVLRLRVMDERGLRLTFSQVVIRNLLRFVDSLPVLYLVGGLAALIGRRGQRLGDYAANTIVVRDGKVKEFDAREMTAGKYNSFHEHPQLEARLRQMVSSTELDIALQALDRRDELDPQARVELFHDLAEHFRSLVTFPEQATFGLTDENYVRNVVAGILSSR